MLKISADGTKHTEATGALRDTEGNSIEGGLTDGGVTEGTGSPELFKPKSESTPMPIAAESKGTASEGAVAQVKKKVSPSEVPKEAVIIETDNDEIRKAIEKIADLDEDVRHSDAGIDRASEIAAEALTKYIDSLVQTRTEIDEMISALGLSDSYSAKAGVAVGDAVKDLERSQRWISRWRKNAKKVR